MNYYVLFYLCIGFVIAMWIRSEERDPMPLFEWALSICFWPLVLLNRIAI